MQLTLNRHSIDVSEPDMRVGDLLVLGTDCPLAPIQEYLPKRSGKWIIFPHFCGAGH